MEYARNSTVVSHPASVVPGEVSQEANSSGVSWPAVFGGALVMAALSLILLALGSGLGLSSVSPWSGVGASATTIGLAAILWLIAMQLIASGLGGYLAGRLRTKWARIHNDEVFFRDTAHGFLAWSFATVLTAAFLASASAALVGTTAAAGATALIASAGQSDDQILAREGYDIDSLFRSDHPAETPVDPALRAEAGRILAKALIDKDASGADSAYLSRLVAAKTGMSESEAERRVAEVTAQARQSVDNARKVAAHISMWLFIALLIGAFSASFAATVGGRQRDQVVVL